MWAIKIIKKYPWHILGLVWILLITALILIFYLKENKKDESSHIHHSEAVEQVNQITEFR